MTANGGSSNQEPRELAHFLTLTREQQAQAIRQMAREGWSDHGIAHATRLSVEMIRRVLAVEAPT